MSGDRRRRFPVPLHAMVHVPSAADALSWVPRRLATRVRRLVAAPALLGGVLASVGAVWLLAAAGLRLAVDVLVGAVVLTGAWAVAHRASFDRWVRWPARAWWRRHSVYRQRWRPAMLACGLVTRLDREDQVPGMRRVRCAGHADRVTVRMLPGQVVQDYAMVADRLAQSFDAIDCRVRAVPAHPDLVALWLLTADPLSRVVAPFDPETPPHLAGLPVAVGEDGAVYRLRLLGTHVLVVGATGAGKGSVLWSLIRALGPAVRDGTAALWVVDPKGGMELAAGRALFARFCHGARNSGAGDGASHELAYADLLEDAVTVMRARQDRLRGVSRLHHPIPGEPLIVVVIDELASLTAYATDRDAKRRIAAALSLLLSQGRAVGVTVLAALQDPRKEVLPGRDLFPTRVALRLTAADQVDMVLGDGARDRGARCDAIAESAPGVGYIGVDGVAEPVRVRFSYLDDTAAAETALTFAPGSTGGPARDPSPARTLEGQTA